MTNSASYYLWRWYISCVSDENYIYFVTEKNCVFTRLNPLDGKLEFLFPSNLKELPALGYSAVAAIDNGFLYGFAQSGKYFWKFNLKDYHVTLFDVGLQKYLLNMFSFAEVQGNEFYFVPKYGTSAFKIDIFDGTVTSIQLFPTKSEEIKWEVTSGTTKVQDKVYCFNTTDSLMGIYDIASDTVEVQRYASEKLSPTCVYYYKKFFYILTLQGDVFSYDLSGGTLHLVRLSDSKMNSEFGTMYIVKDSMWLLPSRGVRALVRNLSTGEERVSVSYPPEYKYDFFNTRECGKICAGTAFQGKYYTSMHCANEILYIDEEGAEHFLKPVWPDPQENKQYFSFFEKQTYFQEYEIGLRSYLRSVVAGSTLR